MAAFDLGWAAFKRHVGPILVEEMAAQSPVGDPTNDPESGTLAASHSWQDGDGGRLEVVSTDERGPIAAYVIRGTREHSIDPLGPYPLHWVGDGGDVFAYHVDHPGTQPNPFNQTAWENRRDEVVRAFRDDVGGSVVSVLNPWRNRVIK